MAATDRLNRRSNAKSFAARAGCFVLTAFLAAISGPASAVANAKYAGYVVDVNTGEVLYATNADARRYPASLTKMMTLYLAFEGLDAGQFSKSTRIPVSAHAASEPPSKLGLRAGSTITVEDAMHALVTKSANDAATALGEFLGGSEPGFAKKATNKARALGMQSTTFRNAHGLPDPAQVTTAADMARLGIALRKRFPHHYPIFETRSYRFGKTTLRSHNRLVGSVEGVDGIKTGFINASGFNLVTSVRRDGRSVVAVVLGGRTAASRDAHMRELLQRHLPLASRSLKGNDSQPTRGSTLVALLEEAPRVGPVPSFRSTDENLTNVEVASAATADPITTGSLGLPSAKGTWAIQIAAVPDRAGALQILENARSAHDGFPADVEPLVVQFSDGSSLMYRARFVGFDASETAWATCRALKQKGYDCWATR
ncbi:D-alanyl-D-alanine carboxypeptidase (plasmid) [Agrobacterium tumefaciens]|nr:D-alanyl-D-alanine carboxypeptidase [Agrobacterium tumefaciens]